MKEEDIKNFIREELARELKGNLFTARKLTDDPTDDLQVVNRRYTNLNGTADGRPFSSVATVGQKYFATDTNQLMIFTTGKQWVNGAGSVVALN